MILLLDETLYFPLYYFFFDFLISTYSAKNYLTLLAWWDIYLPNMDEIYFGKFCPFLEVIESLFFEGKKMFLFPYLFKQKKIIYSLITRLYYILVVWSIKNPFCHAEHQVSDDAHTRDNINIGPMWHWHLESKDISVFSQNEHNNSFSIHPPVTLAIANSKGFVLKTQTRKVS